MSITPPKSTVAIEKESTSFNNAKWLEYFQNNREDRPRLTLSERIELKEQLRKPFIRSIQRFQIGETGDGKHLRKYAKRVNNNEYSQCIELFIREEQSHGQILGEVLLATGGTLLNWHWTDLAFIVLRRMLGLKTEIFIILIAEIVGKCFYKAVSEKIDEDILANIFAIIVLDEIAHLRFHSEFLSYQVAQLSPVLRLVTHYAWCLLFYTACFVFVWDHRKTLQALGMSNADFVAKCSWEFHRASRTIFGTSTQSASID